MLNVYLSPIYGEGKQHALVRLGEEVAKRRSRDRGGKVGGASTGSSQTERAPHPSALLPYGRDSDFVERGEVLNGIHRKCVKPGSRTALVGLGGIGKSQLAIEYAYQTRDQSADTWVFWVHASNAARFEQSFRDIANYIQVPGRQGSTNIFQLVHDWLRDERRKWVLILDNVDDADFLFDRRGSQVWQTIGANSSKEQPLASYLPQCPNGSMLFTARNKDEARKLVEDRDIIVIKPMTMDEAIALLQKKLAAHHNDENFGDLAAALECIPLAIVQAAAYITQRAPFCSVQQYLDRFRENDRKKESLLNREGGQLRRDREAKNSIIVTWQISFEHVRQVRNSAADLLSFMSFFDGQGIPTVLVRNRNESTITQSKYAKRNDENRDGADHISDHDDREEESVSESEPDDSFEGDVIALRNYSFISVSNDGKTLTIHALVQLATRKWLAENNQLDQWEGQFLQNLNAELPNGEYENWERCQLFFPHVILTATRKPKNRGLWHDWALVLYKGAWYAWKMRNGIQTETLALLSMKARNKVLGEDHDDTLCSMVFVGRGHALQGQWSAAEELEMQVMETRRKKLGEDHPHTLTSMANLASTYRNQGRWSAAEELFIQVIETSRKKLGEDHPQTLTSMANLASTYWYQGRWSAAEELFMQVIETSRKKLGEDHPDTLTSIANLASTYRNQGRWSAAEELFMQVIETSRKKLGEDHPDTLTSMANLASTYRNQGRWSAAEELEVQVMETSRKKLGEDHPDTLTSMANLASTYRNHGRWSAAEELDMQVMETSRKKLGEDHPDTLNSMANLAFTWKSLGKDIEAINLMQECVRLQRSKIGTHHPDTISSADALASWAAEGVGSGLEPSAVGE
ncbi:hypothetical protein BKA67DRAFT_521943 [Truncatella angustata]|uniref:NB-ARC domain-containing protein n=1 Tax=Truncatella angustata TaxID=152316 RepID=A0A9P8UE78_9PEZI|nr:uncharacterized protein BKA67DRAFT_521943 [Truncatella angustata]KAH6648299.1 hypothetical protein BKA67DRAFT_521943 [Truncatella angustata]